MQSPITSAATHEMQLENKYLAIALALDINQMMTEFKYQNFTSHYASFAKTHPTPVLLIEGEQHAQAFVAACGYQGTKAQDAIIWALSRVWKAKHESSTIIREDAQRQYVEAERARALRTELFKAVLRLAKNKPEDSFEAGFKAKVTVLLVDAGATQLAALTAPVEGSK
jgi:hypothetical protein